MRVNVTLTINAGTPQNAVTAGSAAPAQGQPVYAKRYVVQVQPAAGGGLVYVMDGIRGGRVPAHTVSSDLSGTLTAGTAALPGGSFSDADPDPQGAGIDMTQVWVDGAHTGDTVVVSWDQLS